MSIIILIFNTGCYSLIKLTPVMVALHATGGVSRPAKLDKVHLSVDLISFKTYSD